MKLARFLADDLVKDEGAARALGRGIGRVSRWTSVNVLRVETTWLGQSYTLVIAADALGEPG